MPIQGKKKVDITKEVILQHVSEFDILKAFWPVDKELKLNRAILSPFRGEENNSFIVGTKFGNITYKDLGDYNYRGDVWNFVKQIEHLADFNSVLKAIDKRFSLGLSSGQPIKDKPNLVTWEQPKIEIIPPPLFQVITRNPTKEELDYWSSYYQDIEDLKRENIYFPKTIYRNRKRLGLKKGELVFCYYYTDIEGYKIYRPFASKKGKNLPPEQWKWDSNIPFSYIESLNMINGCETAFINKSKKDKMLLIKALGTNCICSVQAEDPACMTDETLKHIKNNSKIQVAISDNDKKGKEFSWWLTKEHGYKHCNPPDKYFKEGLTDFADVARQYGIETVTEHFKAKKLI